MNRILISLLATLIGAAQVHAKIKTEVVEYKEGTTILEGYVAYDDSSKGKKPGVVIVHNWMGLGEGTKKRAEDLAKLGYVAFAADIYGKGVRAKDAAEAGKLAGQYKGDRALLRARATAALETLKSNPHVDTKKLNAMGYCFGGTAALELAMSGAPLNGVVSFHGGLDFPTTIADVKSIKSKVVILHGAIDPYVPAEHIASYTKALNEAKVDYQFTSYSGAVHAFTEEAAGNDPSKGAAYNASADKRSFEAMKSFLKEVN